MIRFNVVLAALFPSFTDLPHKRYNHFVLDCIKDKGAHEVTHRSLLELIFIRWIEEEVHDDSLMMNNEKVLDNNRLPFTPGVFYWFEYSVIAEQLSITTSILTFLSFPSDRQPANVPGSPAGE